MIKDELKQLIAGRQARIGVIGLGYVGLPLIVEFGRNGFAGVGFEVDAKKADTINGGASYIPDVPTEHVKELVDKELLHATTDFSELKDCDAIIICVPTPLRKTKEPDVSYIIAAAKQIQKYLRRGQLIILESTTYPGTTDELLLPMFEENGLKLDEDFLLAFSPERVDPGNPQFQTHNIPKVVGGCTQDSAEVAAMLYQQVVTHVHAVSSARVAEAAKLLENTFRAVNIGMANEMARLCYALGIDTWEVIRAAATKPFGFMAFYPGPGIGGHCLVGDETAIVRRKGERGAILKTLGELFEAAEIEFGGRKMSVDGAEVVLAPELEALSLNTATQLPEWQPVTHLFRRKTNGALVKITTSDNRRLTVTDKHPMLVSHSDGTVREVFAQDLQTGDRLPLHRLPPPVAGGLLNDLTSPQVDILPLLPAELAAKVRVRLTQGTWREHLSLLRQVVSAEAAWEFSRQNYAPLTVYRELEQRGLLDIPHESLRLYTGRGPSLASFPAVVNLTPELARLIGYYLAEGCATNENGRERVRFSFHRDEKEFINDVCALLENELGVKASLNHSKVDKVTHIRAASSVLGWLLVEVLGCGRRSTEMRAPDALFGASFAHRAELLKGLLRGDGDVYVRTNAHSYEKNGRRYNHRNATAEVGYFSSSPQLFQQVVHILQEFGFTPTFKRSKPHLQMKGREQLLRLRGWLGAKGAKLEEYFAASLRTPASKTFKQFGYLTTVPVKSVEIIQPETPVNVYSLEVANTHTFATSYGLYVHNCIPLDPHYLSWKARQHGFDSRFISLAEEVNSRMPEHVINLTVEALNDDCKSVKGSRVLILGVAYKKDIDDMRESPALSIIDLLRKKGADVRFHDPFVAEVHFDDAHTLSGGEPLFNVPLTLEELQAADCVMIVADHSGVDYNFVTANTKLIVDTRNALSP